LELQQHEECGQTHRYANTSTIKYGVGSSFSGKAGIFKDGVPLAISSMIWTAKGINLTILREGVGDRRVKEQIKDAPAQQWY